MAYPEYIGQLREEMDSACPEGQPPSPNGISKLWRMDSFLKESQRLNPMSIGEFNLVNAIRFCFELTVLRKSPCAGGYRNQSPSRMELGWTRGTQLLHQRQPLTWIHLSGKDRVSLMASGSSVYGSHRETSTSFRVPGKLALHPCSLRNPNQLHQTTNAFLVLLS